MSFLAPLYALGILAVGLPILFHLIQRQPRGRLAFSSLMFLTPSPPRLTRRSRLNNVLLLILRAAALTALAFAFARPFLRSLAATTLDAPTRRIAVLVDTSASMRRAGLSLGVQRELDALINDLQPTDQVTLLSYASAPRVELDWSQSISLPPAQRDEALRDAAENLTPTWEATDLGAALVLAAETLRETQQPDEATATSQQVVVIGDLQAGSQLDAVQQYAWPANVGVSVRRVSPTQPTNASGRVLESTADTQRADPASPEAPLRVRVANAANSTRHEFRLAWVLPSGEMANGREFPVQVPPGETRVIPVPQPPGSAHELRLIGDEEPFDNSFFVLPTERVTRQVLYLGPPADGSQTNLAFYLQRAILEDARASYEVQQQPSTAEVVLDDVRETPLVIVGTQLAAAPTESLRRYMQRGGRVLCVVPRPAPLTDDQIEDNRIEAASPDAALAPLPLEMMLRHWTGDASLRVTEADVRDYAMLTDIDLRHPIFRPLADARYNDFTKVAIWRHRRLLRDAASSDDVRVLARFDDDQSPALLEYRVGEGVLWTLLTGWHPDDSQLALSTKFIPLLMGFLQAFAPADPLSDPPRIGGSLAFPNDDPTTAIVLADGTRREAGDAGDRATRVAIETPGIYRLIDRGQPRSWAVNLASSESDTAPLDLVELERRGVNLQAALSAEQMLDQQRHRRDVEIESQQQLWRWLLVVGLLLIGAETWLAHRIAQNVTQAPLETGSMTT